MSATQSITLTCDTVAENCESFYQHEGRVSVEHVRNLAHFRLGWTGHLPGAGKVLDFCPKHSGRGVKP